MNNEKKQEETKIEETEAEEFKLPETLSQPMKVQTGLKGGDPILRSEF